MKSITLLLLLAASPSVFALQVRSYTSARHDRFLNFPSAPTANPTFLYSGTELRGVGWYIAPSNTTVERRRQLTLVSPKHFVGANHFKPSTAGSVSFLASDGVVRTYAIGTVQSIPNDDGVASDLFIGTLEGEVAAEDGIGFQPYLSVSESQYVGQSLIFTGHRTGGNPTLRAGFGILQARTQFGSGSSTGALTGGAGINDTEAFTWVFQENTLISGTGPDDVYVEGGDSGSPSLVDVDGVGALVGTHMAVATVGLTGARQITNFDAFVPHYVDRFNAVMAAEGYHMKRAVPGAIQPSTTLTVSSTVPSLIRAGYPVTIPFTVTNTGNLEDANNVKFSQTLPVSEAVSASGTSWVGVGANEGVTARKGGLDTQEQSVVSVTFTPTNAGVFNSVVSYSADEFSEVSQNLNLEVIESYRSWSAGLGDDQPEEDDDGDGVLNLHEYAFGGDPEEGSRFLPGTNQVLLPQVAGDDGAIVFSYLRRKDRVDRALSYEIQVSESLVGESWGDAGVGLEAPVVSSINGEIEKVSHRYALTPSFRFFRVAVELGE
ncbi:MAG: hypothetical protein ACSHYF_16630 [Verrucomicrobiaceae bacterium]